MATIKRPSRDRDSKSAVINFAGATAHRDSSALYASDTKPQRNCACKIMKLYWTACLQKCKPTIFAGAVFADWVRCKTRSFFTKLTEVAHRNLFWHPSPLHRQQTARLMCKITIETLWEKTILIRSLDNKPADILTSVRGHYFRKT